MDVGEDGTREGANRRFNWAGLPLIATIARLLPELENRFTFDLELVDVRSRRKVRQRQDGHSNQDSHQEIPLGPTERHTDDAYLP